MRSPFQNRFLKVLFILGASGSAALPAPEGESTPAGEKPVLSIAAFVDNSNSPVWDEIKEIKPMMEEFINRIGIAQSQSADDLVEINTAREMIQMASGSERLGTVKELAAKGIDKFVFLQLNAEKGIDGRLMDALYGLVLDTRTRDFSVIPLGTYENKYVEPTGGAPDPPKKKIVRKVKIARKKERAAKWAARVLTAFVVEKDRATRDLIYDLNGTLAEMDRKSYGKAIFTICVGGAMVGAMQGAALGLDELADQQYEKALAEGDTTVHPDGGRTLVGVFRIVSVAYALPIAIGFKYLGERIGLGIDYRKLQRKYRAVTGERYRLPKVPRR